MIKLPIDKKELDIIMELLEKSKTDNWSLWAKLWSYKMNVLNKE